MGDSVTTNDADTTALRKLPAGIYIQVFRGKVPGSTRTQRLALYTAKVREFASLGAKGIAHHGFSTELTADALRDLTGICRDNGMRSLAAFGMDSSDPAGKGERIGRVLESDHCDGVLLDAEGAFEDTADGDDKAHARAFASTFLSHRNAVPHKIVCDQPWMLPTVHWSKWPWEEFADCVDARAPQWYWNDFSRQYGRDRVAKMAPKCGAAWDKLNARLARTGHKRPVWGTLQGYAWSDIPDELATALKRSTTEPLFVWCEPWPDDAFMRVWRELHEKAVI
jgi:hypothetical protein